MLSGNRRIQKLWRQEALQQIVRRYTKSANPSYYNIRFRKSQVGQLNYLYAGNLVPPSGAEQIRKENNPNIGQSSNNIFSQQIADFNMAYKDWFYQIMSRLHRSNDWYTRLLILNVIATWNLFSTCLLFKLQFLVGFAVLYSRIRDKGCEPTIDEVQFLDLMFEHPEISKMFNVNTYHVIDFYQEFDKGLDNIYFPQYREPVARFFNSDMNTTSGYYKIGDVESGAVMTINFRTMPQGDHKYFYTDPFYIYQMHASGVHNGDTFEYDIRKPEEELKSKSICVFWH